MRAVLDKKQTAGKDSQADKAEPGFSMEEIHQRIQEAIRAHGSAFSEFQQLTPREDRVGSYEVKTAIKAEQSLRAKLLHGVAERIKDGLRDIGEWFEKFGENPKWPAFSAFVRGLKNISPDIANNIIPVVSPTQALATVGAASSMRHIPGQRENARAAAFLSVCELVGSAGSMIHLPLAAAVGSVKSAVTVCNEAEKFRQAVKKEEGRDRMIEAALVVANAPVIAQAMDGTLALSELAMTASEPVVTSLKDLFASQKEAELKQALKDVAAIIKTPETTEFLRPGQSYFVERDFEYHSAKVEYYLPKENGLWNMHVLQRDGKVFGAYSAFTIDGPNGKHLVVESVMPPGLSHPAAHKEVWDHIMKVAEKDGMKRVWHDWTWQLDGREPPQGFRPFYGSSYLSVPSIAPEIIRSLSRMTVHGMGNGHPTYADYREAMYPIFDRYLDKNSFNRIYYSAAEGDGLLDFRPRKRHL